MSTGNRPVRVDLKGRPSHRAAFCYRCSWILPRIERLITSPFPGAPHPSTNIMVAGGWVNITA